MTLIYQFKCCFSFSCMILNAEDIPTQFSLTIIYLATSIILLTQLFQFVTPFSLLSDN